MVDGSCELTDVFTFFRRNYLNDFGTEVGHPDVPIVSLGDGIDRRHGLVCPAQGWYFVPVVGLSCLQILYGKTLRADAKPKALVTIGIDASDGRGLEVFARTLERGMSEMRLVGFNGRYALTDHADPCLPIFALLNACDLHAGNGMSVVRICEFVESSDALCVGNGHTS